MNRKRRKDYESGHPHRGYSESNFSPSNNPEGGSGRFKGSNYGGTGSGGYYGDDSPYPGGNTGSHPGAYSTGLTGSRDSYWEDRGRFDNDYNTGEHSSYGGGRIEPGYGRDEYRAGGYRAGDRNEWSGRGSRSGYYGASGGSGESYGEGHYGSSYGEYENDRRARFGGRNEEGTRRGTSGNFTGPGRGGHRSASEDNFGGPGYPGNDRGRAHGYGDHQHGNSRRGGDRERESFYNDHLEDDFYGNSRSGWEYGDERSGPGYYRKERGRRSGRRSSDRDKGNYGDGRSSRASGGNTSEGGLMGGSTFSDPWL